MATQLHTGSQEEESPKVPPAGVVELVQRFAEQVMNYIPPFPPREQGDDARKVILDVEVNGVRCLLVRLRSKPPGMQVMLSPREQEIARMVAKGYPNKTIAAVLDISSWTVGTHLRRIFAKLGVGSRAAMVAKLLQEDIMQEQPEQTSRLFVNRM
jgi:DNA-binding CsgD family transcriptional regulator